MTNTKRLNLKYIDFKNLCTYAGDDFSVRRNHLLSKINDFDRIQRSDSYEILEKYKISVPECDNPYTIFKEIEINAKAALSDLSRDIVGPLLFIDCVIGGISLSSQYSKQTPDLIFYETKLTTLSLKNIRIQNLQFKRNSVVESLFLNEITIKSLLFEEGIFGKLEITSSPIDCITLAQNSHITKVIIKDDCKINNLNLKENTNVKNLIVSSSILTNCLIINSILEENLLFNETKIESVNIYTSRIRACIFDNNSRLDSLKILETGLTDLTIKGEVRIRFIEIKKNELLNNIYIENGCHAAYLHLVKNIIGGLFIWNSTITQLKFRGNFAEEIQFKKCVIELCEFSDIAHIGQLHLLNCNISIIKGRQLICSRLIIDGSFPSFKLSNCQLNTLVVETGSKLSLFIDDSHINLIDLSKTILAQGASLSLSNTKIYSVRMDEFSMLGNFYFRRIQILDTCLNWPDHHKNKYRKISSAAQFLIKDEESSYLKSIKQLTNDFPKPTFRISHSSLGKTEFTNCLLGDFRFEFNNSRITDCFISGGTIPSINIVIIDDQGNELKQGDIETHSQKASIYNQFKKIFEAQGDAYRAAQFQAKWAEHQKKYLQLEYRIKKKKSGLLRKPWTRLMLIFGELSQDIGIFRLNRWSSNHGESWLRALLFTIIATGFSYLMFLWSIGRCFNTNGFDWSLVGYFFEFLTLTFRPDFITGDRPSSCSIGLYYAGKAVFAYGLYQFIAAFRKHGRKK